MSLKQVILVRQDLKMPKGKMSVQVAHASVEAAINAGQKMVQEWSKQGMKKIALKVADEKELMEYFEKAKDAKLPVGLIKDAGRTFLAPGTTTCLGIGPADEKEIDKITGKLKMV
ncbi:peptidyl-tRNA hydrolase Pth2 [Candidatus Woesearchaeota archaeon]|nr:peptidyl-tRNA hydrolase Pth2 [Candidatus Woesearchaeota archaeon]MBW3017324.1 peptidyl-tRNA hydrolase Pth2 [Candidatus Woesearchaeota archaeon]